MEEQWKLEHSLFRHLRRRWGEQETRTLDLERALHVRCEMEEEIERKYAHCYETELRKAGLLAEEVAESLAAKAAPPCTPHLAHPVELRSGLMLDGFPRIAREAESTRCSWFWKVEDVIVYCGDCCFWSR